MSRSRLVLGLGLIAVGVLFLLDRLDAVDASSLAATWWPLLIVGLGCARLLERPPDRLGGGVTAGVGLVLLAITQGAFTAELLAFAAPLGLIAVGLWVMLDRQHRRVGARIDAVRALSVFSGRKLTPSSHRFSGGSLVAVFGGIDLDLRHVRVRPEGALLDVTTIFGGVDVVVPPGWRVEMRGPAIFGGYTNHTEAQVLPDDAPVLVVRVLALFGGVEVKLGAPARV